MVNVVGERKEPRSGANLYNPTDLFVGLVE